MQITHAVFTSESSIMVSSEVELGRQVQTWHFGTRRCRVADTETRRANCPHRPRMTVQVGPLIFVSEDEALRFVCQPCGRLRAHDDLMAQLAVLESWSIDATMSVHLGT